MVDRRDVLKGGLAAGAGAMAAPGPALAVPPRGDKTYVLVHGAWHNARHWQPVASRLSALGHRVVAVDLPAYYNDVAYEDFLPYAVALTPDLPVSFWTTPVQVSQDRWGRIPRTFIRCLHDRALAPAVQDRMIADADRFTPHNTFKVETMAAGHSAFASSPNALATILANLT